MFRRIQCIAVALGAGFLLGAVPAAATTITTTIFSTWDSSSFTTASSQFELNFATIQLTSYNTSTGIVLYGIQHPSVGYDFTGPDNNSYNLTGVTYHGLQSLAGASDGVGVISVATPSGGANALFLGIGSTGNTPLTLTLSDGETFPGLSPGLFGFSLSHPITGLTLSTTSGSQPVIDDFWYGNSSLSQDAPTVEAATYLLMGGGLLVLIGARRELRNWAS